MDRGRCRSCGEPILWVEMAATGRKMPLDVLPVPAGNVVLGPDGRARVLGKGEDAGETPRYVSHYATCPQAVTWRGRGRGG